MDSDRMIDAVTDSNMTRYTKEQIVEIIEAWREEAKAKAKPDPRSVVLDVVRKCERESREAVSQAMIEVVCAGVGIFPQVTKDILFKLKANGQIYDPGRNGKYKVV